jgi:hypothetical protein
MDIFNDGSADLKPEWARLLPAEVFGEIVASLRKALPSVAGVDAALRDRAALATVGSLRPATAVEAMLAVQFVVADANAMDCLRLAAEAGGEFELACKRRAQAMAMMREGKSALKALRKLQLRRPAGGGPKSAQAVTVAKKPRAEKPRATKPGPRPYLTLVIS